MAAFILIVIAIVSGALATYFYEPAASLFTRLAAGTCTGFAGLGLLGFIISSLFGLTTMALLLSAAIIALPLLLLLRPAWRSRVALDLEDCAAFFRRLLFYRERIEALETLLFALLAFLLWFAFQRAMFQLPSGIYTGVDNNLGDLPFHLGIITGFARGENFPPQHPEFSGVRLTYPFIVDFVSAMLRRAGASLESSIFWESFLLGLSVIVLMYRWAVSFARDRIAGIISVALVFFSGGLGWLLCAREALQSPGGPWEFLWKLPHDYTIFGSVYRWGNAITTLFIPQRGLLMGVPMALLVWKIWWESNAPCGETEPTSSSDKTSSLKEKKQKQGKRKPDRNGRRVSPQIDPWKVSSRQRMISAGVITGALPLVHAHTFVVLMMISGCLALIFLKQWQDWVAFFLVALALAAPQMWWATRGSATQPGNFFAWQFGWDHGDQNVITFWLRNTGLFIPLLIAGVLWGWNKRRAGKYMLLFYLPFLLCFAIPNVAKVSPWIWDNIKVLFYWYIASAPFVGLLLAKGFRKRALLRFGSFCLLMSLLLGGALDIWRVVSEASQQREFDRDAIAFAGLIERQTPPDAVILHAPVYNDPVYLSGRRSLLGYEGHLWSQGIDYEQRDLDVRAMYAGSDNANTLLARYGIQYIVVSPLERSSMPVKDSFFNALTVTGEVGAYRLYKIGP